MSAEVGTLEVRCFCNRKPLLAICGRDQKSKEPFVHIKVWKGQRLYTEAVITSGVVRIRCRECFRWHKITITLVKVEVRPDQLPETISV